MPPGTADLLSSSSLTEVASCQLEAVQWLCHWYRSTSEGIDEDNPLGGGEEGFNPWKALLNLLSGEVHVLCCVQEENSLSIS